MRHLVFAIASICVVSFPGRAGAVQLGAIDFPSSGSAVAQEYFIKGVLYLHSFEYGPAADAFREAQRLDSGFAMAYWGEAMTYNHPVWFEQDLEAARAALARLAPTPEGRIARAPTEREKAYLRAVDVLYGAGEKPTRDTAYAAAMRDMYETYPDDLEAAAFYALSLLGTSHGGRVIPTYMKSAAVVEDVFRENPKHPGAVHYLIHSYDDPIHAPLGLRAARAYSTIAPAAGHAQHMTSHIFVAMGMWDDVVRANEAAWEVSGRRSGHYNSWLQYGYLQQGRRREALQRLEVMRDLAAATDNSGIHGYVALMKAAYVIDSRDWGSRALMVPVPHDRIGVRAAVSDLFAVGLAHLESGDRGAAATVLEEIGRRTRAARAAVGVEYDAVVEAAELLEVELSATLHLARGETTRALEMMADAAAREDAMPFEFGPPFVAKPTHELHGEMLLGLGRAHEAYGEFQSSLARAPRRVASLLGLARSASAMGELEAAADAYREIGELWHGADPDLPEREEVFRFVTAGSGR